MVVRAYEFVSEISPNIDHCFIWFMVMKFSVQSLRVTISLGLCEGGTSQWEFVEGYIAHTSSQDVERQNGLWFHILV